MDERRRYFAQTLRAVGWVITFVVATLAAYRQFWAIPPLLVGAAMALALFLGWDRFVQAVFTPEAAKKKLAISRSRRTLFLFALIKYPLVATLIWWLSRRWDSVHLMVFIGGFLILQVVMVLRGVGRLLVEIGKT